MDARRRRLGLTGLRGLELSARLDEPILEVGIVVCLFLKSVKDRARPGAKLIQGGPVSAGSL
jgi:hypothetical protein